MSVQGLSAAMAVMRSSRRSRRAVIVITPSRPSSPISRFTVYNAIGNVSMVLITGRGSSRHLGVDRRRLGNRRARPMQAREQRRDRSGSAAKKTDADLRIMSTRSSSAFLRSSRFTSVVALGHWPASTPTCRHPFGALPGMPPSSPRSDGLSGHTGMTRRDSLNGSES